MRIIPKNTKVSTEFFKGVTLADMVVGFIGVLIVFLLAISSLPYRGYMALGFAFILVFLLVRIDDEANYMFLFRIIRHFSYFRSYRKPGFEYPEIEEAETEEDIETMDKSVVTTEEQNLEIEVTEEQEQEVQVTEEPKEKDPLHLELEEEGFEILDLDDISVDVKSTKKVTETMTDNKKKHRKVFGKK